MSVALLEAVNLFDGNGAIIFVQRQTRKPPVFHVVPCANIRDSPSRPTAHEPAINILLVTEHICVHTAMFANVIQSIAHDPAVLTVCAESEELAVLLVREATTICCIECGEDVHD
ncbi:hypothetical protein P692DRAFT_20873515 [Suillus brevipes Sb2]|nr:hypothetical protein P692DRAFT_20873515 [Suillus brevipes Sb2]